MADRPSEQLPGAQHMCIGSLSPAARSLWAKSGDWAEPVDGALPWLSLAQHMLDSALVAGELWDHWASESLRSSVCRFTGLSDPDDARGLVMLLAGVHDIGKATVTFQLGARKEPQRLTSRVTDAGLPLRAPHLESTIGRFHHSLASGAILEPWLIERSLHHRAAGRLAGVVDAHHGKPSAATSRASASAIIDSYPEPWRQVHRELIDFIAETTGADHILPLLPRKITAAAQQLLTGLVVMSDWVASSEDHFPLTGGSCTDQRARLESAMRSIRLTAPWEPGEVDARALDEHMRHAFSWGPELRARPVQRVAAEAAANLGGPGLLLVEAPTGEGKTEAALVAAQIMARESGCGGVLIAAPTMSTADGLLQRVLGWANNVTPGGSVSSMHLGHSRADLNSDWRNLRSRGLSEDDEQHGEIIASEWLRGRKKGILSNFAVTTVDQVLMMALQSKHSMVRHLGLAGKVVVIDEVHAYDTYMSSYLHTALAWLASYGVPVVLLSATLPSAQKRDLIAAYAGTLGVPVPEALSTAYPLVTGVGSGGVTETPVFVRPVSERIEVAIIPDSLDDLAHEVSWLAQDGGCVLIVCNTVRRSQSAFSRLDDLFPGEVELHHAAFIAQDRARKESALRDQLGPHAHRGSGRPWRRIVVATQVAEQSLDIDADLLVTDIAPMDLMIQRIGRLHRHERPDSDRPLSMREPRVLVRGISDRTAPAFDKGTAFIYEPEILISTLGVLEDRIIPGGFERPGDVAASVQDAYGEDPPIPRHWEAGLADARSKAEKRRSRAKEKAKSYRFPEPPFATSLDDLFSAQQVDIDTPAGEARGYAQVRDSDASYEVIPLIAVDSGYRALRDNATIPWGARPAGAQALELASSTLRLPASVSRAIAQDEKLLKGLEQGSPAGWAQNHLLKSSIALLLDENRQARIGDFDLLYDDQRGLVVRKNPRP